MTALEAYNSAMRRAKLRKAGIFLPQNTLSIAMTDGQTFYTSGEDPYFFVGCTITDENNKPVSKGKYVVAFDSSQISIGEKGICTHQKPWDPMVRMVRK